jgi:hypothetical protein
MGTPHFPTLTASRPVVFFPAQQEFGWHEIQDDYVSGHVATRARWSRPRKTLKWTCDVLDETDKDIVMSFLYDRQANGGEAFYFDNPISNVLPPYDAPTLSESAGGALAERTYYVKTTWSDGTNETTASQEGTQLVAVNKFLTVSVLPFPTGATEARLYIGTSTGVNYRSGTLGTTGTTWTQDSTATTVDDTSAAGQKVLYVAATAGFQVGNAIIINSGGARQEVGIIDSIAAGVSLTLESNLTYEHTLAQGDAVASTVANSGGGAVPTSNTLEEEMYVILRGNPVLSRTRMVNTWALSFELVQAFA